MTAFALTIATLVYTLEPLPQLPPLNDGLRFPPIPYLRDGCHFNRAYRKHLLRQLEMEPQTRHPAIRVALEETDYLYHIWDDAWWIRDPIYDERSRRCAQKRLIKAIGWEAYWRAELPPCVPLWRFNQMK